MGSLNDLIDVEVERFTTAVKALVADAVTAVGQASAQTIEEEFPSTVTPPTAPVTVPDPTPPAVPEPVPVDPGVEVSPGGDAQTVPEVPPGADEPQP